jgi:hypothetical protein
MSSKGISSIILAVLLVAIVIMGMDAYVTFSNTISSAKSLDFSSVSSSYAFFLVAAFTIIAVILIIVVILRR